MNKSLYIFLGLCCLSIHLLFGQRFSAFVDKKEVPLNGDVEVSFQLDGVQGNIVPPKFEKFRVVGGPVTRTNMQIVNGKVSQSVTYSYYLQPTQKGTFSIGSASVEVDGKTLTTQPIEVKVVDAGAASGNSGSGEPQSVDIEKQLKKQLFVRASPSRRSVYEGEQLSLTYKFFTRVNFSDLKQLEAPDFNGFWVENIDLGQGQQKNEIVDGVQYTTDVIKKVVLFPQRSGKLQIGRMELEAMVPVRVSRPKKRRSPFDDPFFGDVFGDNGFREYIYSFKSNPITIEVKPLPSQNKPSDFSGIVGAYSLDATVDKAEIETGEPITYSIKLSGKGNFKSLQAFELNFPNDFEVYEPQISDRYSVGGGVSRGSKSFDYLIVPQNPGTFTLPELSLSIFNPEKKRYETLKSEPFTLKVTGEPKQSMGNFANMGKGDIELLGEDIRFIHTRSPKLRVQGQSFFSSWGFKGLWVAPVLLFLGLVVVKRRQDQQLADVAGTRSKKANRVAVKKLKQAATYMEQKESRSFYDEVSRTVWGYISDKLDLGQSEFFKDKVNEQLGQKGVAPDMITRVTQLIDTCEMALFAPSAGGLDMNTTYEEAKSLITDLENQLSA